MHKKILVFIGMVLILMGCSNQNMIEAFDDYHETLWKSADGYSNGTVFNCTWRQANVTFDDGKMALSILEEPSGVEPIYSGGEYRTHDKYGYGLYTVKMKPAKNIGIVSSFFTYTGPSEDEPWDEIDIEFLGKDTTKVQFNYFTNGKKPNGEFLYDLGFDASESYHEYGFHWQPDAITWYVDGVAVYTATKEIPKTPGRIMMNIWPGKGVDGWLGKYDGKTPVSAYYDKVTYESNPKEMP